MTRTLMLLALLAFACGTGSRSAALYQVNAGGGSDQDFESEPDVTVSGPDSVLEPEQDTQNMLMPGPDTEIEPDTQAGPEPDTGICIAQCAGVVCGPDPICGFNCGGCDPLWECIKNTCQPIQECGSTFTQDLQCTTGLDGTPWVIQCSGDLPGDWPGGYPCAPPFFCGFDPKKGTNGCITDPPCVPFCGPITDWENWEADGTPMTRMMECGNDGCYGECGECPAGTHCGGELCADD